MKFSPWYLRWLGFRIEYQIKVLSYPKQVSEGEWVYMCELISYNWYWWFIKFKTILV